MFLPSTDFKTSFFLIREGVSDHHVIFLLPMFHATLIHILRKLPARGECMMPIGSKDWAMPYIRMTPESILLWVHPACLHQGAEKVNKTCDHMSSRIGCNTRLLKLLLHYMNNVDPKMHCPGSCYHSLLWRGAASKRDQVSFRKHPCNLKSYRCFRKRTELMTWDLEQTGSSWNLLLSSHVSAHHNCIFSCVLVSARDLYPLSARLCVRQWL